MVMDYEQSIEELTAYRDMLNDAIAAMMDLMRLHGGRSIRRSKRVSTTGQGDADTPRRLRKVRLAKRLGDRRTTQWSGIRSGTEHTTVAGPIASGVWVLRREDGKH